MTKTLSEQAMEMYQRQAYNTLKLFKKTKKKSWAALGINPKMEALIMKGGDTIYGNDPRVTIVNEPITVEGTISGRLPKEKKTKPLTYPQQRFVAADISVVKYAPREIHALKGTSSHGTISIVNQVVYQEKFRADPRFSLFQIMERVKRYKAIFAGPPYQPIFA